MRSFTQPAESPLAFAAAKALARRDRGLTGAERLAQLRWLEEHPAHAAALARLERAWRRLDALRALQAKDGAGKPGFGSAWRPLARAVRRREPGHHHGPGRCARWNRNRR